jgi:SAM-dependent methyltransferase
MRPRSLVRRNWPVLIVLVAAAAWWPAYNYLVDFRKPDVPYVTTPDDVMTAMFDLAEVTEKDTVYDLGSGDGRIVVAAARDRGAKGVGIEIDPELAARSRETIRAAGMASKVQVIRGDIFKQDLTPATVVTLYLLPNVNERLRPQLDALRPGTRIVSHMYSIKGARPVKKIEVHSDETRLVHLVYLWVAPIDWE